MLAPMRLVTTKTKANMKIKIFNASSATNILKPNQDSSCTRLPRMPGRPPLQHESARSGVLRAS
eukprot:14786271-Alexandrium_andersonii.AAC.1